MADSNAAALPQEFLDEQEANTVRTGKTVRVARGRKVPIGTEGVCIWRGEGRYGMRVGIEDFDGTVHWTNESNVEIGA